MTCPVVWVAVAFVLFLLLTQRRRTEPMIGTSFNARVSNLPYRIPADQPLRCHRERFTDRQMIRCESAPVNDFNVGASVRLPRSWHRLEGGRQDRERIGDPNFVITELDPHVRNSYYHMTY